MSETRFAIISDVHSNLEALQTVLAHIDAAGIDEILCLGDVVGYGPSPVECLDLVMARCKIVVCGNHDDAVVAGPHQLNTIAREAIEWTKAQLKPGFFNRAQMSKRWAFLEGLPSRYERSTFLFLHGSPRDPIAEYILPEDCENRPKMREIFDGFGHMLFVGHSHVPGVYTQEPRYRNLPELKYAWKIGKEKAIVNVGSVGQPRDRDPRACYVEIDGPELKFHRVEYDIEAVVEKVKKTKRLHEKLGLRLREGI